MKIYLGIFIFALFTVDQFSKYLVRLKKIRNRKFSILVYNIRIKSYMIFNKNYEMIN